MFARELVRDRYCVNGERVRKKERDSERKKERETESERKRERDRE